MLRVLPVVVRDDLDMTFVPAMTLYILGLMLLLKYEERSCLVPFITMNCYCYDISH